MVPAAMNSNATSDADDAAAAHGGDPVYAYKPNLAGALWVFKLTSKGIEWEYGRRSGVVGYDKVSRVRMAFRPATLQGYRFLTEIWSPDSPKLQISSASFRGLTEMSRQDKEYTTFLAELHRRLAAAGSVARFETGMNALLYWIGAAVMTAIGVTLLVFLVRVLMTGDLKGAAVVVGIMALFVWQVGTIFVRNRPRIYRPDALPPVVLPRVR